MSGHSHFKSIKAQKEIADKKKGKVFSKIARLISIAVKNGVDPATNPKLRTAIEQAKAVNMPKENVERAIKRGTGELGGENLEEIIIEGLGPGGIAIIIEGITDNKNRTLLEIKQIFQQNGGKLTGEGSIQWMFERKGIIIINSKSQIRNYKNEELELTAIESGADDVRWYGDELNIYTKLQDLEKVKQSLEEKQLKIESSSLGYIPKEEVTLSEKDKEAAQKLFEMLDENDAVQEIYSNLQD